MDGFVAYEQAVQAFFVRGLEDQFVTRRCRVANVASWAARAMRAPADASKRYQDLLYRIAVSASDDHVLIDRVRADLAAAGIVVTLQRVGDGLKREDR